MMKVLKRFPALVGALVIVTALAVLQGIGRLAFLVEPLTFADGRPHPVGVVVMATIVGAIALMAIFAAAYGAFHLYHLARKIGQSLTED